MALEDPVSLAANAALTRRYRSAAPERILWNDTIARLLDHRTVRGFRPDPLSPDLVPTLVAAAQSAATSSNLQLWSVVAIEDEEKRKELARLAGGQKHIEHAPLILLFVADLARAGLVADEVGAPKEGFEYLESFTVAAVDAALAAQNAVIAAESLGLGTVYIGALRNHPEEVAKLAGLPPRAAVVFGLVVGWSDATRPAAVKPRLPQSVVLHREAYDLAGQSVAIAEYDRDARAFQEEQGQDPVGWRALVLARGASAAALNGRDRLKAALRALGFGLK
ncbi:nitroreductase [Novosphingobium sp. SG751A]|uniref:nitroreductase family protein n=1 Tax=Novosphingobium sp. SG751A TaxID=2587000 RepID=UPI0015561CEE|nr:nitroreductase family protein [Novosphingobium sp. SG751A]NOW45719.1 nitroreductase [Novosphingobium sp. SG751A]